MRAIGMTAMLMFIVFSQSTFAKDAVVKKITGAVGVKLTGNLESATIGKTISEGAIIVTGAGSRVLIILSDGSEVELDSFTTLKFDKMEGLDRKPGQSTKSYSVSLQLKVGGVRSKVPKVSNLDKKFKVETPQGTASVRGTELKVEYSRSKGMSVYAKKDKVELSTKNFANKTVIAGEKSHTSTNDTKNLHKERLEEYKDEWVKVVSPSDSEKEDALLYPGIRDNYSLDAFVTSNTTLGTTCK